MGKKKRVIIIGAGPAGITAALKLSETENDVRLYESTPKVGGMSKTIKLWDQLVDIGPHRFFSSDRRVNELWLDIIKDDYLMVSRKTRIFYKQKYFSYPIKAFESLLKLGIFESFSCVYSYIFKPKFKKIETFEQWVISRFGVKLYSIFFKSYSEKLWGIRCDELDYEFAAQRIKKLSLYEIIKETIRKTQKHKTLVDEFAYPYQGTGSVYEKMAKKICDNGSKIFLDHKINKVVTVNNRITGIEDMEGKFIECDHLISTMPITSLVKFLGLTDTTFDNAIAKLKFRNTIIVYLEIDSINLFEDQWLYIHSPELKVGRITNFRNWSQELCKSCDKTIIAMEYWANHDDNFWGKNDEFLIKLAKNELQKSGLNQNADISKGFVLRIPRCYPIYHKGYRKSLDVIKNALKDFENLSVIGRYGSFKYNNQDHSILMGINAANNINGISEVDLWEVNSDYDYQEKALITKTGLKDFE
jgi:protoporphyrinogen oxidase